MTDINTVVLVGRVTRDIGEKDFGYLPSGAAKLEVSIAINRSKKQGDEWIDEVSFFEVVVFGKPAENLKKYIQKGKQIAVTGSLKQDRWESEKGKHSKIYIIADSVQLLGGTDKKSAPENENLGFKEDIPF